MKYSGEPSVMPEGVPQIERLAAVGWPLIQSMVRTLTDTRVALALILALALTVRLWDLNWDDDQHLHPDERFLTMVETKLQVPGSLGQYFNTAESPLNPYNQGYSSFVYGTFPLFFTKLAGEVLDEVADVVRPVPWVLDRLFGKDIQQLKDLGDYGNINLVGRLLSAFFDAGTIAVVFLIGRHLYDRRVGLLAALLLALTVAHIQHSHFFVVDTFVTFFSMLTIYYAVLVARQGRWSHYALAGVAFGLAVACKLSAFPLAGIIVLAAAWHHWSAIREWANWLWEKWRVLVLGPTPGGEPGAMVQPPDRFLMVRVGVGLVMAALISLLVFRVAQPYAFDGPHFWDIGLNQNFRDDITNLRLLQDGTSDYPPSIQWIGRTPYLFPLKNIVVWGMGLPLGVVAWTAFAYATWRLLRHREPQHLLLVAWIAVNFGYSGGRFITTMRYFLPIYPALVILGAWLLTVAWNRGWVERALDSIRILAPRLRTAAPVAVRAVAVGVVIATVLWALAFTSIYRRPVSRVEASEWIYDNIPEGTAIAGHEHWDDPLPLSLPDGRNYTRYQTMEMTPYDPDSPEKAQKLLSVLDRADYIILSSNRVYGSVRRLPARWPVTTRYYDLLFAEELGFHLRKEITSYPSLFGVSIPDQGAEEAFTVYDHPKVHIFEKTADYSPQRARALLDIEDAETAASFQRAVSENRLDLTDMAQNGLLLRPADLEKQRSGGTFADLFDLGGFSNSHPLLVWLFTVELVSLAVLPMGLLLFRALPDRGYLLSKPLGFLVLSYLVWLGVAAKAFDFTQGAIAGALVLMVLAGLVVGYVTRRRLLDFVRGHWRAILLMEALFLAAFLAFYFIRLNNPDLWHAARGGEKPMDFAYLNAVTRSTTLPPYDAWMSGGYINYYYFGQFMTATLTKFTGILPEVAYNLAVPLFFALTVGATFSIGYNLTEAARKRLRWRPGRLPIASWTPVGAGLLAVLLVTIVGNLNGLAGLSRASDWHLDVPVLGPVAATVGGMKEVLFGGASLGASYYWDPTRMMPPTTAITEFPFFTFMFADLHAHLMAIPFAVTSLGMGLSLVLAGTRLSRESPRFRAWLSWGLVIAMALVIGALRWINSWDYPPFLLMGLAALFLSERAIEGRANWRMLGWTVVKGAVMVALSYLLFLPFQRTYALPATGFHATPETTPFHQYLSHFGLFLFLVVSLLAFLGYRHVRRQGPGRSALALVAAFVVMVVLATLVVEASGPLLARLPVSFTITGLSAFDFLGDLLSNDIPVAAFALLGLAVLVVLAWREFSSPRPDTSIRLFVFGMIALALFLSAGVEVAVLDEDIQRMNTVFKFYLHIWILLALASAFGVWYLLAVARPQETVVRQLDGLPTESRRLAPVAARSAFAVGLVALLLSALVYPFFALPERVEDRFVSLGRTNDGLAFMQYATYGDENGTYELRYDYEAIRWLRDNVEGSPPIIEAVTPEYRWGSRISIYTGLPAVAGWNWHQRQQRGDFAQMVLDRQREVQDFYSTPDVALAQRILDRYDVAYVIVGQLERGYYPPEGIAKIEAGLGGMLTLVFDNGGTQIYRVHQEQPALLATR